MTMQQIFERFSPLNFAFSEWRKAAKRFLELEQELESAGRHADQDHEHQDFEVCEDCTRAHELCTQFQRFAEHFGLVWARVDYNPGHGRRTYLLGHPERNEIVHETTRAMEPLTA